MSPKHDLFRLSLTSQFVVNRTCSFQVAVCEIDTAYSNVPLCVAVRSTGKMAHSVGSARLSPASSSLSSTNSKKSTASSSNQTKDDFLRECRLLSSLQHPNLIRLVGVITDCDEEKSADGEEEDDKMKKKPLCFVLEHSTQGDLYHFLKQLGEDNLMERRSEVVAVKLVEMCAQIAAGMKYLESRNIVHKDLAARQVQEEDHLVLKWESPTFRFLLL